MSENSAHAQTESNYISYALKIDCGNSQGTGFRINESTVVTARHVVAKCKMARLIDNDGHKIFTENIVLSPNYDIAYLSIKKPIGVQSIPSILPVALNGYLYTVGAPIDGLVMSQGRLAHKYSDASGDWLVIDIPADHGNSGGPVFSVSGLVGMVISKNSETSSVNAYSIRMILREFTNLRVQVESPNTQTAIPKESSKTPLLYQLLSAMISSIFGGVIGIYLYRWRLRRKKFQRIIIKL